MVKYLKLFEEFNVVIDYLKVKELVFFCINHDLIFAEQSGLANWNGSNSDRRKTDILVTYRPKKDIVYYISDGGREIFKDKDKEVYNSLYDLYVDNNWIPYIDKLDDNNKLITLKYLEKVNLMTDELKDKYKHLLRSDELGLWSTKLKNEE